MTNHDQISPPNYLVEHVENVTGTKAIRWTVPDCGLSTAMRFSVMFEDGRKVFVKASVDDFTEQWLRTEHLVLSSTKTTLMPSVVAWIDTPGIRPVLLTQDLSDAYWPAGHSGVAWRNDDFNLLINAVKELSFYKAPAALPALQNRTTPFWAGMRENPEPFLNIGVCSPGWFRNSIEMLVDAESKFDITGDCLVHGDIRSDNICVSGSQIKFVDWSHAARGSRLYDLANLLPTLHLEGGPAPFEIMPDGGAAAAAGCASLIERVLVDQWMPDWLKNVFGKLIAIDLAWAAQCMGMEQPDGAGWK